MFSAFSSIDYQSIHAKTPAETAVKRLAGIGEALSGLHISKLRTQEDMARALWTLDAADKCVRLILAEFRREQTVDVVREGDRLIELIEAARDGIAVHRDGNRPSD